MGTNKKGIPKFALFACIALSASGIMFGYDNSVMSGAIGYITDRFTLNPATVGMVVSGITIGAVIGALFAGVLTDAIGRKKALLLAAVFFAVGSLAQSVAQEPTLLIIFRFVAGLGIGLTNTVSPVYIAEIAPSKIRGAFGAMYQLLVSIGLTVVFFINAYIASSGDVAWNVSTGWRLMLGMGAVPAIIVFVLVCFVPESPRWLRLKGRTNKAAEVLGRIREAGETEKELAEIDEAIERSKEEKSASFKAIFKPGIRKIVGIGFLVALFQHITGIDGIIYYCAIIFEEAGLGRNAALYNTIFVGITLIIFTIVAILLVDRVGRKVLLVVGTAIMVLSLLVLTILFKTGSTNIVFITVSMLIYIAGFSIGMGSVTWVVLGEIFPTKVKGVALSLSMTAYWIANFLVAQFIPIFSANWGMGTVFLIFCVLSFIALIFYIKILPETKGKTLEEIESDMLGN